jgi:hypothetical protein
VLRVDFGNDGLDHYDLYLVINWNNREVRLPFLREKDGTIVTTRALLFVTEPTPQSLGVSTREFEYIRRGVIEVGMSERSVYYTLGVPTRTNRTTTTSGTRKQLVYGSGRNYIYTENGVVVAIQN